MLWGHIVLFVMLLYQYRVSLGRRQWTVGWPRVPQMSNLQQLPISCGSIHLLDNKTLKDYILSSKISPDQAMSKIGLAPLRVKKKILEYRVYCIQNDWLGHTVPTKQTVN